jgi:hypothetical protein
MAMYSGGGGGFSIRTGSQADSECNQHRLFVEHRFSSNDVAPHEEDTRRKVDL